MNRKVIYFLKRQGILTMVVKNIIIYIFLLFISINTYSNVLYKNNDLVITDIDINIYKKLYLDNYKYKISSSNALKDLILISNVLSDLEINNKSFLDKIDNEILIEFGIESIDNKNIRDFIRFSKIRNEFISNYFKNKLTTNELEYIFKNLDNLNLPISKNDCLIIYKVLNLQNNEEFIKNFLYNLKNNSREFLITIKENKYQVCIDDKSLRYLENQIINYIQTQTEDEFIKFVYDKTKY